MGIPMASAVPRLVSGVLEAKGPHFCGHRTHKAGTAHAFSGQSTHVNKQVRCQPMGGDENRAELKSEYSI